MLLNRTRRASILAFSIAALLLAVPFASAEIPHENYDLVGSNLDMVVQLLNQGINATELALVSCLYDRPADGMVNLTLLDDILVPVSVLINQIRNIADSYFNLSYLTPPFDRLYGGGDGFILNQTIFLQERAALISYEGRVLSPSEGAAAQRTLIDARQEIYVMNHHLDTMDFACDDIANLTVENKNPFNTTYLKELIDRLRIKMDDYLFQIENIFHTIDWGVPFLSLALDKTDYYLGETVLGSGYIFDGTAPAGNVNVFISKDSAPYVTVTTTSGGTYSFSWHIPIDAAQLGAHNFSASATAGGTPVSDYRVIHVFKIPIVLTLQLNGVRFSPEETVIARALLRDYEYRPLTGTAISFDLDGRTLNGSTELTGAVQLSFVAATVGWGGHNISAGYGGSDVYDSAVSPVSYFEVNIPTKLVIWLSTNRAQKGDNVTVIATLFANTTEPLGIREVVITIDGSILTSNMTAANGSIIYLLSTSNLSTGMHILRAWFTSPSPAYADAISDPAELVVFIQSSDQSQNNGGGNQGNNQGANKDWWHGFSGWLTGNIYWIILLIIVLIILAIVMLSTDTFKNAREMSRQRKLRLNAKEEVAPAKAQPSTEAAVPVTQTAPSPGGGEIDFSNLEPRIAIVRRYGTLLSSLRDEDGVPIKPNMTAREIGALLVTRHYQSGDVREVTGGFERALYSAEVITADDWKAFEAAADSLGSNGSGKG